MTLIAAYFLGNIPIVLGDILISGPERTDTTIAIPTVGESTNVFPSGSGYSIVGIQQKVTILSDDLAVAWAGNVVVAKTLINELTSIVKTGGMTVESLNTFLRKDAPEIVGSSNASLVGVFRDTNGLRLCGYKALQVAVPGFTDIILAGSGAEPFKKILLNLPSSYDFLRGAPNALEEAVGKSLMLTGLLLHLEIGTHDSLRTFYGAGYELASMVGGRFLKIENVTYLFWYAEMQCDGVRLNLPHAYLKYAYKDDALLIRSLRPKPTTENELDDHLYISRNPWSPRRQYSVNDRPNMNSRFVCSYVLVQNPPQEPEILCLVDFEPTGSKIFKFEDSGEKVTVMFEQHYLQRLLDSISLHWSHRTA